MTLPDLTFADVLQPEWRVAPRVAARSSRRVTAGVSLPPFGAWRDGADWPGGLNLGRRAATIPSMSKRTARG